MLRLHNTTVRRGERVLARLDTFHATHGDVVGVIGRSGVGKTTLLEILAGALPLDGDLTLDGVVLTDDMRRNVALRTIQNFPLFHWLTARKLIELAMAFRSRKHDAAILALRHVEAEHLAERYPTSMSGGERARVSLALAWALDVQMLLLDEPFNGLDPLTRILVGSKLFARFRERSTTVFFVTHNLDDIVKYANRCLVFSGAHLIEANPRDENAMLTAMQ